MFEDVILCINSVDDPNESFNIGYVSSSPNLNPFFGGLVNVDMSKGKPPLYKSSVCFMSKKYPSSNLQLFFK